MAAEGAMPFLTTCHCPSLTAFPPLVSLNVCWFLNWTSMCPPLSPSMNHEPWEDSAYSTTPSGSNVRKSNSAANLMARRRKTEGKEIQGTLMPGQNRNNHACICRQLLTLCSPAVDNARTSQEGPKTAPPGTTSPSACGRINPHTRGSSGSSGCSLPSEGPGGRHSGTRSCPLCLCRSPRTGSSRTHPRLKRQEVTKTRVGLLFFKKKIQTVSADEVSVAISPLQVLEVKLYWKPLGHLHSYMPGMLTHRAGSLQMLGYNWHSSISGTDRHSPLVQLPAPTGTVTPTQTNLQNTLRGWGITQKWEQVSHRDEENAAITADYSNNHAYIPINYIFFYICSWVKNQIRVKVWIFI